MGSSQKYNLKWNEFSSTLSSGVGNLLQDKEFVDITLSAEGKSFSAHKLVLSACSPYFKSILTVSK